MSSGAPPTWAGSPATATSCSARLSTAPRRSSSRASPRSPTPGASGTWSTSTASPSSTPRRRPSARSWRRATRSSRGPLVRACGCSERSVSPSIPRRGAGTTRRSATGDAPSWTRGGRPRPAASCSRPLPGAVPQKPGSATLPFFGIQPQVLDAASGEVQDGETEGILVIADSWPSQARTVYGNHERFVNTYFTAYEGKYFTGDGCRRDADGYYWITGRVDDVINVSGHRMGTAEVESALVLHEAVAEAAVVGHSARHQGAEHLRLRLAGTGVHAQRRPPRRTSPARAHHHRPHRDSGVHAVRD